MHREAAYMLWQMNPRPDKMRMKENRSEYWLFVKSTGKNNWSQSPMINYLIATELSLMPKNRECSSQLHFTFLEISGISKQDVYPLDIRDVRGSLPIYQVWYS